MEVDQTQPQMDPPKAARFEIAYVLFVDLVGYSSLPMDRESRVPRLVQEVIRGTREFREAQANDQFVNLPTGDGMALVPFGSLEDR